MGHKQTCAAQKATSALPLKATENADIGAFPIRHYRSLRSHGVCQPPI